MNGYPEIKVAWETQWNMPGMESYSFNAMMNGILHPSGKQSDWATAAIR